MMFGAVGVALMAVGFFTSRETWLQSHLIGFIFWTAITLGSMAVLMVQYLSGGAWGLVARRMLRSVDAQSRRSSRCCSCQSPSVCRRSFPGPAPRRRATRDRSSRGGVTQPDGRSSTARRPLVLRAVGRPDRVAEPWSKEQDDKPATPARATGPPLRLLAGPGLVIYMLTITLMSVDWVMSLDPH